MKIAIIGTRGIPNNYGGFEQLAQHLAAGLAAMNCDVTVYSPHTHPYKQKEYCGARIVHCHNPEGWMGAAGQFIYDLNCIRHARRQQYDCVLFTGYTSSSVWWPFYPRQAKIVYNMDGLEWQRGKYSRPVRSFLQLAEKLAVQHSHQLVADSEAIKDYLCKKFGRQSCYIPYGAVRATTEDETVLRQLRLEKNGYCMLLARMEPENNIDMILDGFSSSSSAGQLVVVGNSNAYSRLMQKKYGSDKRICFAGPVYDAAKLRSLRSSCRLYFHGHSAGGTNPSLLEAMADGALVAAHDNPFNRAVLQQEGIYFSSSAAVRQLVQQEPAAAVRERQLAASSLRIQEQYNWPLVTAAYFQLFKNLLPHDAASNTQ